jgi:hypothetical protein
MRKRATVHWKTTLGGIVLMLASFTVKYAADMRAPKLAVDVAEFVVGGGILGLGALAKDQ